MDKREKLLKEIAEAYDKIAIQHELLAHFACERAESYSVHFNIKQAIALRTLVTKIERGYTQF